MMEGKTDGANHEGTGEGQRTSRSAAHICDDCGEKFTKRKSLMRHVNAKHLGVKLVCDVCCRSFTRLDSLRRHTAEQHDQIGRDEHRIGKTSCPVCGKRVRPSGLDDHQTSRACSAREQANSKSTTTTRTTPSLLATNSDAETDRLRLGFSDPFSPSLDLGTDSQVRGDTNDQSTNERVTEQPSSTGYTEWLERRVLDLETQVEELNGKLETKRDRCERLPQIVRCFTQEVSDWVQSNTERATPVEKLAPPKAFNVSDQKETDCSSTSQQLSQESYLMTVHAEQVDDINTASGVPAELPGFLRLPTDIRDIIYELVLVWDPPIEFAPLNSNKFDPFWPTSNAGSDTLPVYGDNGRDWHTKRWKEQTWPALLRFCRQILWEATPVFYGQPFRFSNKAGWLVLYRWLLKIGPHNRRYIRDITVCHPALSLNPANDRDLRQFLFYHLGTYGIPSPLKS